MPVEITLKIFMKLSFTFRSNFAHKRKKLTSDRILGSEPPEPCSKAILADQNSCESPFKSVDNGQSGQVTIDGYPSNANCYVDIGSSCDANGLHVEITHLELEVKNYEYYDYDKFTYHESFGGFFTYESYLEYYDCYDTIHFASVSQNGETVKKTDPQCGCLREYHPSCDEHPFDDYHMAVTERPTQYSLAGTDVKLLLQSNNIRDGGKIQVDWKCSK